MVDLRCGTPGYDSSKCKSQDYVKCSDLGSDVTLQQLYYSKKKLTLLQPGEIKKNNVSLYRVKKADEHFWAVFPYASGIGICSDPKGWFAYIRPQGLSQQDAGAYDSERSAAPKDGFDAATFFRDLEKDYKRRIKEFERSDYDIGKAWELFKKETIGAGVFLGLVALLIGRRIAKRKGGGRKAAPDFRATRESPLPRGGQTAFEPPVREPSETIFPEARAPSPLPEALDLQQRSAAEFVRDAIAEANAPVEVAIPLTRISPPPPAPHSESGIEGIPTDGDGNAIVEAPFREQRDTPVDLMGQQLEPDFHIIDTLIIFDPQSEAEKADSPLREIETRHRLKVPEHAVKRAAVLSNAYLIEQKMLIDALTEVVEKAAELSMGRKVTSSNVNDAVTVLAGRSDEGGIDDFQRRLEQTVKEYRRWIGSRGYSTEAYERHMAERFSIVAGVNGNGSSSGIGGASDLRQEAPTREIDHSQVKVVFGDSVPDINLNQMGLDPDDVERKAEGHVHSKPDEATGAPHEVPSELIRSELAEEARLDGMWFSMGGEDAGDPAELSMSLEFKGLPQRVMPPFASASYYAEADKALGDYIDANSSRKRVFGSETAKKNLAEALRTVLWEAGEEVAKNYFNEEGLTQRGWELSVKKQTSITQNYAQRNFRIMEETRIAGDLHPDLIRSRVTEAMEGDLRFSKIPEHQRGSWANLFVRACIEVPGFADIYVSRGESGVVAVDAEGVVAAPELLNPKKAGLFEGALPKAGARINDESAKAKAKAGEGPAKSGAREAEFMDPFADFDGEGIFDAVKPKGKP